MIFPISVYFSHANLEPIEQCNPYPTGLYDSASTSLKTYSEGCVWIIPDKESYEWIKNEFVADCRNLRLDLSDKPLAKMWAQPVASKKVQDGIQSLLSVLKMLMFVSFGFEGFKWIMFVVARCLDESVRPKCSRKNKIDKEQPQVIEVKPTDPTATPSYSDISISP